MPKQGFTLVESLVVITIMMFLTLLILLNYNFGEKTLLLADGAAKLEQNMRRAEEMAMSAKEFSGQIPQGGYGLVFALGLDYYIIFADLNADLKYSGSSEMVETVSLGTEVKVQSLSPVSFNKVIFTPPSPRVTITNGDGTARFDEASVILSLKSGSSQTKTVKVNRKGLIESY